MIMNRVGKIRYYLSIAEAVSSRATCLRRQFGAIIVMNEQVVASGYCGAPRGTKDCLERNSCMRKIMNIPSGERYELCRSVHAEQNAIINAARAGVNIYGGDMYIWCYCRETNKTFESYPCLMCLKVVANAGLKKIYYLAPEEPTGMDVIDIDELIEKWNEGEIERFKKEIINGQKEKETI